MYERWTAPRLSKFVDWTKGKMVVSMLGSVVADYLPAWESVYFHSGFRGIFCLVGVNHRKFLEAAATS